MTARISLNLGRTGGHRPPLQSEHFLPLGKASFRTASREIAKPNTRNHAGHRITSRLINPIVPSLSPADAGRILCTIKSVLDEYHFQLDPVLKTKGECNEMPE